MPKSKCCRFAVCFTLHHIKCFRCASDWRDIKWNKSLHGHIFIHIRIRRSLPSHTHIHTSTHERTGELKFNVHFDHRICLFLSDLLLMSDCFHVSCALHFYSLLSKCVFNSTKRHMYSSLLTHTYSLLHFYCTNCLANSMILDVCDWENFSFFIRCWCTLYACGLAWQIKYRKNERFFKKNSNRKEQKRRKNQQHELNWTKHCIKYIIHVSELNFYWVDQSCVVFFGFSSSFTHTPSL